MLLNEENDNSGRQGCQAGFGALPQGAPPPDCPSYLSCLIEYDLQFEYLSGPLALAESFAMAVGPGPGDQITCNGAAGQWTAAQLVSRLTRRSAGILLCRNGARAPKDDEFGLMAVLEGTGSALCLKSGDPAEGINLGWARAPAPAFVYASAAKSGRISAVALIDAAAPREKF